MTEREKERKEKKHHALTTMKYEKFPLQSRCYNRKENSNGSRDKSRLIIIHIFVYRGMKCKIIMAAGAIQVV